MGYRQSPFPQEIETLVIYEWKLSHYAVSSGAPSGNFRLWTLQNVLYFKALFGKNKGCQYKRNRTKYQLIDLLYNI